MKHFKSVIIALSTAALVMLGSGSAYGDELIPHKEGNASATEAAVPTASAPELERAGDAVVVTDAGPQRATNIEYLPIAADGYQANGSVRVTMFGDPVRNLSIRLVNSSNVDVGGIASAAPTVGVPMYITGIAAGTYTAKVKFDGWAPTSRSITVGARFANATAEVSKNVSSYGGRDGSISAMVSSGSSRPQTFTPSISVPGATISCVPAVAKNGNPSYCTFSGLPAGVHTVTITPGANTDFQSSLYTFRLEVTQPAAPAAVAATLKVTPTGADLGANNGVASIDVCNINPMPGTVNYTVSLLGKKLNVSVAGGGKACKSVEFTGLSPAKGLVATAVGSDGTTATSAAFEIVEIKQEAIIGKPTVTINGIVPDQGGTGHGGLVDVTFCNTSSGTGEFVLYSILIDGAFLADFYLGDGECARGTVIGYRVGDHTLDLVGSDGQSVRVEYTIELAQSSFVTRALTSSVSTGYGVGAQPRLTPVR